MSFLQDPSPQNSLNDHFLIQFNTEKTFIYLFFYTTDYPFIKKIDLGIGNGDFHLDSWLNTDGSDLLDNFRRAVQVNESLWILIWNRSQVLEPSPQGVFLVVILRVLVGIRTGPFTLRFFSFETLIKSAHTFSRDFTLQLVRVILIRWMATSGSTGVLPVSLKAMAAARLPDRLVPRRKRTAVSQEQEKAALSSPAVATISSSKIKTLLKRSFKIWYMETNYTCKKLFFPNLPSGFYLVLSNADPTDLEIKSVSGFNKLNKH